VEIVLVVQTDMTVMVWDTDVYIATF